MPYVKGISLILAALLATSALASEALLQRPLELVAVNATSTDAANATSVEASNATIAPDSKEDKPADHTDNGQPAAIAGGAEQASSLKLLSDLRTRLAVVTVQEKIAEKESRIRQYQMPQVRGGAPFGQLATTPKSKAKKQTRPKVLSIQGTGEKLSAYLAYEKGVLVVREGDKVGSGKVLQITPDQVVVQYGASKIPLLFTE